jgi:hypothetical protein
LALSDMHLKSCYVLNCLDEEKQGGNPGYMELPLSF